MTIQPPRRRKDDRIQPVKKIVKNDGVDHSTSQQARDEKKHDSSGPNVVERDGVRHVVSESANGDTIELTTISTAKPPSEQHSRTPEWLRKLGKWLSDHL